MLELNKENQLLSGVYCISNTINKKVYIGSTKCFKTRIGQHLVELKGNYHSNKPLQNFVNKYGIDKLKINILEITDINNIIIREQYYLDNNNLKFNTCIKAGVPNVKRNFTHQDIQNIADLYNSGKCVTEISKIYFNSKHRQNYIAAIVKGEIYSEYKYLFNEYKTINNKSFNEQIIKEIAKLYNSGKTGCQISEILYDSRNYRGKINDLIKGKTYKEYAFLFNYRTYTQKGKKRK